MTLEHMAKIAKLSVVVKMGRVAILKRVSVFVRLDGQELCVPIDAFLERMGKIAQNYVSALIMVVVIISRASVFVHPVIRVTNVSIPVRTTCMA